MQKSIDSPYASAYAIILTNGLRLFFSIFYLDIKMRQQAPSLILDALADVMVPFLSNAGLSLLIDYYLYLRIYWS